MPILYAPPIGTMLLCDYDGIEPEMTKRRPVVLISCTSPGLAMVVPLSTTPPDPVMPWHYLLVLSEPFPGPYSKTECWVKCDMVSQVSYSRLNLFRNGKDKYGKRRYVFPSASEYDMDCIRGGVARAIGSR